MRKDKPQFDDPDGCPLLPPGMPAPAAWVRISQLYEKIAAPEIVTPLAADALPTARSPFAGVQLPSAASLFGAALLAHFQLVANMHAHAPAGCFLWEQIFPSAKNRPAYNPSGRYMVRLFHHNRWRKVVVDDKVPVDEAGLSMLPISAAPNEVWPLVLGKALLKVFSGQPIAAGGALILHALTGWFPTSAATSTARMAVAAAAFDAEGGDALEAHPWVQCMLPRHLQHHHAHSTALPAPFAAFAYTAPSIVVRVADATASAEAADSAAASATAAAVSKYANAFQLIVHGSLAPPPSPPSESAAAPAPDAAGADAAAAASAAAAAAAATATVVAEPDAAATISETAFTLVNLTTGARTVEEDHRVADALVSAHNHESDSSELHSSLPSSSPEIFLLYPSAAAFPASGAFEEIADDKDVASSSFSAFNQTILSRAAPVSQQQCGSLRLVLLAQAVETSASAGPGGGNNGVAAAAAAAAGAKPPASARGAAPAAAAAAAPVPALAIGGGSATARAANASNRVAVTIESLLYPSSGAKDAAAVVARHTLFAAAATADASFCSFWLDLPPYLPAASAQYLELVAKIEDANAAAAAAHAAAVAAAAESGAEAPPALAEPAPLPTAPALPPQLYRIVVHSTRGYSLSVCAATEGAALVAADRVSAFDANAAPPASARGSPPPLSNAICAFDEGKCGVSGAAAARVWQVRCAALICEFEGRF